MTLSYIYKITNKFNGKVYIGKTTYTVNYRWNQHISAAFSDKEKDDYNFLLHKAIRKYGAENFLVELLEEVREEDLSNREIYWIDHFNSCILEENSHGYNMTYGGEGSLKINREEIFRLWNDGFGSLEISKQTGHYNQSIKRILKTLDNYSKDIDFARNTGNTVYQYDENGRLIRSYPSISYAAKQVGIDPSMINKCCNGSKQSCAGSFWSFSPEDKFEPKKLTRWRPLPVLQYSLDGELINRYDTLSAATRAMGKKQSRFIKECCEGKRKEMYGYIWKYEESVMNG